MTLELLNEIIDVLDRYPNGNTQCAANLASRLRLLIPLGMCDLHKAAPDLLAALHGLREWIREPWGPDDGAANGQVIAAADAALAKARGLGVPHDRD